MSSFKVVPGIPGVRRWKKPKGIPRFFAHESVLTAAQKRQKQRAVDAVTPRGGAEAASAGPAAATIGSSERAAGQAKRVAAKRKAGGKKSKPRKVPRPVPTPSFIRLEGVPGVSWQQKKKESRWDRQKRIKEKRRKKEMKLEMRRQREAKEAAEADEGVASTANGGGGTSEAESGEGRKRKKRKKTKAEVKTDATKANGVDKGESGDAPKANGVDKGESGDAPKANGVDKGESGDAPKANGVDKGESGEDRSRKRKNTESESNPGEMQAAAGAVAAAAAPGSSGKRAGKEPKRPAAAASPAPDLAGESGGFDGQERSLPFEAESADHAETPFEAYRDVAPLLDAIAKAAGKTRATLWVYDPYFCDGSVKRKLGSLGFMRVTNPCEDFYAAVAEKRVPPHDVVVTNPPYSADHMERILRFCAQGNGHTPWLVLMPHFVYTKRYYDGALGGAEPFYVAPKKRYYYHPPSWTEAEALSRHRHGGSWTSPFPSFWYCHLGSAPATDQLRREPPRMSKTAIFAADLDGLPNELRAELDPNKKRKNPKARKRAAKKRAAEAMGLAPGAAAGATGAATAKPPQALFFVDRAGDRPEKTGASTPKRLNKKKRF